jgi:2-oxoisovalerate dehydrogenase E1 component alpha subunit
MTERWHPDERLPVIARFEVRRRAYLAPDGSINRQLPAFASDTRLLVRLYRAMVLVRAFDMKAVALQRTGRLGTYAASLGQEAVSVGTASAMRSEDVLLPSYRDNAALIWRGVKLEEILLFWGGDERGNCFSGQFRIFRFAFRSDRRPPTLRASPTPSRRERSRALPYVCSATAPPRRATSGRR